MQIGVFDIERSQEPDIRPRPWQTDTCVGGWFYDVRARYKTAGHVLEILVDVVAKNGNLLLNILQQPDGSIDDECRFLLDEMARWMAVCGEGIFGTSPFRVFGEGPSRVVIDHFREDQVQWSAQDIRFTQRGDVVYAFLMRWPVGWFGADPHLHHIRQGAVGPTARPRRRQVGKQSADGLRVTLPGVGPAGELNCLAIQLA